MVSYGFDTFYAFIDGFATILDRIRYVLAGVNVNFCKYTSALVGITCLRLCVLGLKSLCSPSKTFAKLSILC